MTKLANESTLAKIIRLVNEAQTTKSPTQLFTDKVERWYVPVVIIATFGVVIARNLSYLVGPLFPWFTGAPWYTAAVSVAAIVLLTIVSLLGLRVGKWLQNVGGAAQLLMFTGLIAVPFVALQRGVVTDYHPLAAALPTVTLFSLNIFGKMALGALSGFEYVAILAGECRSPARTIGRAVLIAVPVIASMFILGTSSVLALVPQDRIDLISPIPQTLGIGFAGLGIARFIVPILILFLLLRQIGNVALIFAGNSRLPMVAGWDRLLPAWFTRLHPRFRTPRNSILFVGALTLVLALLGQVGVGVQEAFQLLENVPGAVRDSDGRREAARCAASALVEMGLRLRVRGHPAVLDAVGLPDHRRRELEDLRREDRHGAARCEPARHRHLRARAPRFAARDARPALKDRGVESVGGRVLVSRRGQAKACEEVG